MSVLGEGNTAVIEKLQASGTLIKEEAYEHKYPYDWRTKKPTIFRATSQVPWSATDSYRLLSIAIDCHRLLSIAIDCHRLPSIAIDCHRLPSIAIDCHRCHRLPSIA